MGRSPGKAQELGVRYSTLQGGDSPRERYKGAIKTCRSHPTSTAQRLLPSPVIQEVYSLEKIAKGQIKAVDLKQDE